MIVYRTLLRALLALFLLSATVIMPAVVNAAEKEAAVVAKQAKPLPLEELRTFTEIFEHVKAAYVEPVEDRVLLENAIKGMLAGLDPHSNYLDPAAFKDLRVNTRGEFGGLGIEVGMEQGVVRVVAPIDDTPAKEAGILAGDLIIKLDGQPVQGMALNEAVKLMRGKVGTSITLTILREGVSGSFDIDVTRAVVKLTSVKKRLLEEDYAYLRISQFQVNTGKELLKAMKELEEKADLKGYVLDLRNNPGGVLQAAVAVSDAFLNDGIIVYTKGRLKQSEFNYNATAEDPSKGLPVVILINGGSASASEIVAGALQDHQRAVIMGTPSFGKGSVQTVLPLTNDRALKLTTALYYTPKGRSIQAEGIIPDILVEPSKVTKVDQRQWVKEADLKGHLGNGGKEPKNNPEAKTTPVDKSTSTDFQLNEALNLLKGISIYRASKASG